MLRTMTALCAPKLRELVGAGGSVKKCSRRNEHRLASIFLYDNQADCGELVLVGYLRFGRPTLTTLSSVQKLNWVSTLTSYGDDQNRVAYMEVQSQHQAINVRRIVLPWQLIRFRTSQQVSRKPAVAHHDTSSSLSVPHSHSYTPYENRPSKIGV